MSCGKRPFDGLYQCSTQASNDMTSGTWSLFIQTGENKN